MIGWFFAVVVVVLFVLWMIAAPGTFVIHFLNCHSSVHYATNIQCYWHGLFG